MNSFGSHFLSLNNERIESSSFGPNISATLGFICKLLCVFLWQSAIWIWFDLFGTILFAIKTRDSMQRRTSLKLKRICCDTNFPCFAARETNCPLQVVQKTHRNSAKKANIAPNRWPKSSCWLPFVCVAWCRQIETSLPTAMTRNGPSSRICFQAICRLFTFGGMSASYEIPPLTTRTPQSNGYDAKLSTRAPAKNALWQCFLPLVAKVNLERFVCSQKLPVVGNWWWLYKTECKTLSVCLSVLYVCVLSSPGCRFLQLAAAVGCSTTAHISAESIYAFCVCLPNDSCSTQTLTAHSHPRTL